MTSFRDWVVETSSTTGTGAYALSGSAPAGTSYFTFRQRYANGDDEVVYWVVSQDRTKWEKNRFGTLTYGSPDTLSRNVVESTNGDAPVSWVGGDTPLRIYVVPDADAEEFAISMGFGATRPPILKHGLWMDEDGVSADIDQLKLWNGASDVVLGRSNRNDNTFQIEADVLNANTWVQLATANPNAAASVAFTGIPSWVNHIRLTGQVKLNTNDVVLNLRTYDADGNLDTGASDYFFLWWTFTTLAASGLSTDGSDSVISLGSSMSNAADWAPSFDLIAANIQSARYTVFHGQTNFLIQDGSATRQFVGSGGRVEADRITGVQLFASSGTLGSGADRITLWGAK